MSQIKSSILSLRNSLLCMMLVALSACGFQPVYKQGATTQISNVGNVEVAPIKAGRIGQLLQNELEDAFNPGNNPALPRYRLEASVKPTKESSIMDIDRSIDRYLLLVNVDYRLIDVSTNKAVLKRKIQLSDSYASQESDFATYSAEQDAMQRVTKALGHQVATQVAAFLAEKN